MEEEQTHHQSQEILLQLLIHIEFLLTDRLQGGRDTDTTRFITAYQSPAGAQEK